MKAIVIHHHGGPEMLKVEDVPIPSPEARQVLVNNRAIGVNYVDAQHRAGLNYPVMLPLIPGIEAAGIVEAVGSEVSLFTVGDRVGYAGYMGGNYAEYTSVPEDKLIPIPKDISFDMAAATLLQGMTAHCLANSVYPIRKNDIVLIHAAAGGVGLLLVQMAKQRGATVIGTLSSKEKVELVRSVGCDYVIASTQYDFAAETMRFTNGEGVHVIYDSVGQSTFDQGINVLRSQGYMVIFGLSSGPIPALDINRLSGITGSGNNGSLFLTWATLNDYTARREERLWRAKELLSWIGKGDIRTHIAGAFALGEAVEAHRLLENRDRAGKILLLP